MSHFQPPILVLLKDCGEVRRFKSVLDMQFHFEQVDVDKRGMRSLGRSGNGP
jgi:hypothetical protein